MSTKWLTAGLALSLALSSQVVWAKPKGNPGGAPKGKQAAEPKERVESKQAIMRTAKVLKAAQKEARRGGAPAGLGLAIGHQEYALHLHREGQYSRAIYHTLRARALATAVIDRNKGVRIVEVVLTPAEVVYRNVIPKDADLDAELKVKFSARIPTDLGALKLDLVFNL